MKNINKIRDQDQYRLLNSYFKQNHNLNYINITDLLYSLDIHDVKLFLN